MAVGHRRRGLHRLACRTSVRGRRHEPVVLDDLSSGHRNFVAEAVASTRAASSTVTCSTLSSAAIRSLASFTWPGSSALVSVSQPLHTYSQNVTGMIMSLETMAAHA